MAVNREWKCQVCGFFESASPVCPSCGTLEVQRVFLTPPGFKSDMTKFTDGNIAHLVKQSGRSDYTNNESTKHTPTAPKIWQPYNKGTLNTELAQMQAAGVDLKGMKKSLPGKYDAAWHAEDVKKRGAA